MAAAARRGHAREENGWGTTGTGRPLRRARRRTAARTRRSHHESMHFSSYTMVKSGPVSLSVRCQQTGAQSQSYNVYRGEMASNRGSHGRVGNSATSKATPTGSHHHWARVPAGFFLHVADILTRMHRHACIEVYNAPMTSTAVKITIIIAISVLLYTNVVTIEIHACLCSKLLPWPQKLPRNRSFRIGLHEEVPPAILAVEVHFFM